MGRDDWFRRRTWTEEDRADFEAHFARSRGNSSKAQYLRIQAVCLAEASLHREAIELIDRILAEYPETIERAIAHEKKAESIYALGRVEESLGEFRLALDAERRFPNVRTNAWLEFGWIVVSEGLVDSYDETLQILEEFNEGMLQFPVARYRYFAILALIADSRGGAEMAREMAANALRESERRDSGFRYHAKLGLVEDHHKQLHERLKRIANR